MSDPTRRHTLTLLGAGALAACAPPKTVVDPTTDDCATPTGEQTAGPYYPGEPEVRQNIIEGKAGVSLDLDLTIVAPDGCAPHVDVEVDLWSADAGGNYSGYDDFGTAGQDFLRGQQRTDADGVVRFTAVVPGSYPGRAVHLHVKVRVPGQPEHTTQIYLPDDVAAEVLAEPAYADGARQTSNDADNFYTGDTLLDVTGSVAQGLAATGTLVV